MDYTDVSNTVAKSLGVDELGKCGKYDIVARTSVKGTAVV